jgi:hypothetical protein
MTNESLNLQPFRGNPPASESEIADFEKESGIRLPDDYSEFLRRNNGGSGFVGANYVDWGIDKLIEYNRGYSVDEYAPGLLLFGSDGGGEALAFDRRYPQWPIVSVSFIPLNITEAVAVALSFGVLFDTLMHRDLTESK